MKSLGKPEEGSSATSSGSIYRNLFQVELIRLIYMTTKWEPMTAQMASDGCTFFFPAVAGQMTSESPRETVLLATCFLLKPVSSLGTEDKAHGFWKLRIATAVLRL